MKKSRFVQFFAAFALIVVLTGSTTQQANLAKAQPQLIQLAAEKPNQRVAVIIQKMVRQTTLKPKRSNWGVR